MNSVYMPGLWSQAATVNFDHQILNQSILKSKWIFVPNLEKFLQGAPWDIAFTRMRGTNRKHKIKIRSHYVKWTQKKKIKSFLHKKQEAHTQTADQVSDGAKIDELIHLQII